MNWIADEFMKKEACAMEMQQVERFLFYPEQAQWILKLPEYLKSFEK